MSASATETSPTAADWTAPQLSTDYLNRHSEALMLLEMVPVDREIVGDLKAWRAVGYFEHFAGSPLRCAGEAMAAYRGLGQREVQSFDALCAAMDRLIYTATALLDEMPAEEDPGLIVDVASLSLRRLIARATAFINANGQGEAAYIDPGAVQADIDAVMAN
ncbi:MAG: hypothetical protein GY873_28290 [Bosea sp.]|uniref:hypothetical protein n=1 Tax=Bosea sp. (in: a-proteobacteria) TaxID=1871050 RepID=UPI00239917E8|nr:hypothetical protein [Bosea sp. (in: a-proteobacteria)]MCP4738098.1 hypothetical protein [Bosea sp. (in: a-proteobacteria)]